MMGLFGKSNKIKLQESDSLRGYFAQYLEQNLEHFPEFGFILDQLDKIIFVRSDHLPDPVEIFDLDSLLQSLFPDCRYIVICNRYFNDLLHDDKLQRIYHICRHIPRSFDGTLLPHDHHGFFTDEAVKFKQQSAHFFVHTSNWASSREARKPGIKREIDLVDDMENLSPSDRAKK